MDNERRVKAKLTTTSPLSRQAEAEGRDKVAAHRELEIKMSKKYKKVKLFGECC